MSILQGDLVRSGGPVVSKNEGLGYGIIICIRIGLGWDCMSFYLGLFRGLLLRNVTNRMIFYDLSHVCL